LTREKVRRLSIRRRVQVVHEIDNVARAQSITAKVGFMVVVPTTNSFLELPMSPRSAASPSMIWPGRRSHGTV
jgi:hypothetical protein